MPKDSKVARKRTLPKWLWLVILTIWACGIFYVIQITLAHLFRFLLPSSFLTTTLAQALYSFTSYLISLCIVIFLPRVFNKSWKTTLDDLGIIGLPTWTDIGLALVGLVAYFVLASLITALFTIFPWFNASEAQDVGFSGLAFGTDRYLIFTVLVILAPIAEELLFRGYLYGKLKKQLVVRSEIIAIIVSTLITSVAFGFMHGQWNVGVNVFAMSIVLCLMREVSGSTYAGILMHMLKNAAAFYLLFVLGTGSF